MSSDQSDHTDEESTPNFFNLKNCLSTVCTKFLRKLLKHIFPKYVTLQNSIPLLAFRSNNQNGYISERNEDLIKKSKNLRKFKFELLCYIFKSGTCNEFLRSPSVGWMSKEYPEPEHLAISDDIKRLWTIWEKHIAGNIDEELSDNDSNSVWCLLEEVACRMAETYEDFGAEFKNDILTERQKLRPNGSLTSEINMQIGDHNRMEIDVCPETKGTFFIIEGNNNKIYVSIQDRLKESEKRGESTKRLILHCDNSDSDDSERWERAKEKIYAIPLEELNNSSQLLEHSIDIKAIQDGCLIIDFTVTNCSDVDAKLQELLSCIFEKSNVFEVLNKQGTQDLNLLGYVYDPQSYVKCAGTQDNFNIYNHMTLFPRKSNTRCDVDMFVSDFLEQFLEFEFSSQADENICIHINGDIMEPRHLTFTSFQESFTGNVDKHIAILNRSLDQKSEVKVSSISNLHATIHVVLKTEKCVKYTSLVSKEGPLLMILRYILESDAVAEQMHAVKLMKLGVLVYTLNNGYNEKKGKDIVFHLSSDSKLEEAIENGSFPKVLTAMLGGHENLKNLNQLRLRAVLDDVQDQSGEDSDQAIDLSDVPEFQITDQIERAMNELELGNLGEAKHLAQVVYQSMVESSSDDVILFKKLLDIYEQCADNFHSLKCFCKVRLLESDELQFPDILIEAMLYWMDVLEGPYDLKDILQLITEIESMAFEALENEKKKAMAVFICGEIVLSYRNLMMNFKSSKDSIEKKLLNVQLEIFQMFLRDEEYEFICSQFKSQRRASLTGELLYVWAVALKELEKFDVAMKKVEEAIQYFPEDMKATTLINLKELQQELQTQLDKGLTQGTDINVEWLEGTNIKIPQQMKDHAHHVQLQHKKKQGKYRRKKQHDDRNDNPEKQEPSEQNLHMIYKECTNYSSWKDVPPHIPEAPEKRRMRRRSKKTSKNNETQGVKEVDDTEIIESDSGQESNGDSSEGKKKPFSYQDPAYLQSESGSFTDSGLYTFDKLSTVDQMSLDVESKESLLKNIDLVVHGIQLSTRCETGFSSKDNISFHYPQEMSKESLIDLCKQHPAKYKKCTIDIESAHKAVCTNMNFADDLKEICISGRSKCGKSFTDDEVVVEVLGESKARSCKMPKQNFNLDKQQTRDTNTYGLVLGTIKRHRYRNLDHPVLLCTKDEFATHMMKPLCKTVPKIHVSNDSCNNNYQVDLFTYDKDRKTADYRDTLDINQAHKKSYCFLVAIIKWDSMYPFGITLKVINTKGDISSGIDILRLQYRVPSSFDTETDEAAEKLQNKEINAQKDTFVKALPVFTMRINENEYLDSAYSVEKSDLKEYRVGVHICDPTSIIQKDDVIDKEARRRGAIFNIGDEYPPVQMLPKKLIESHFLFKIGDERKALTLFFTISLEKDENYISDISIEKTVVKSIQNIHVTDVQRILKSSRGGESDIDVNIKILQEVSLKLRKHRIGNGAYFTEVETTLKCNLPFMEHSESASMVKELHLFTNHKIAKIFVEKFQHSIPCICHAGPSEDVIIQWMNDHKDVQNVLMYLQERQLSHRNTYSVQYSVKDNINNALPIQKCVWEELLDLVKQKRYDRVNHLLGADEIYPWQALALEEWINVQGPAEYKCPTKLQDNCHYELRYSIYTAFTAPLRRYVDLVVHRLVHAYIDKKQNCPYQRSEIEDICCEMNEVRRHRKLFFNSCQVLLCGHELQNQPQLFNGFVQGVTNINIELFIPSMRMLPRSSKVLPLNLMKTRQRPTILKETERNRNILTLKWQDRIYSFKRKTISPPKDKDYLRINPHQQVKFKKLSEWTNILKALTSNKEKDYKSLFNNMDLEGSFQTRPECSETVNDVSSEVRDGNFSKQTCSYSLSFNYGQIITVQMSAEAKSGMLQPVPQLLDLTNNVKLCLQHVRDPVGVLSQICVSKTKDRYSSCKEYISLWMPIYAMEVATQTIEDDTITINDIPIKFNDRGGYFTLKFSYLEKRDIEFTSHSIDLLGDATNKVLQEENDKFYLSGSDFLCIRCELTTNISSKTNFGAGAICPNRRFWIGHAKIDDIRFKTLKTKEKVVEIHFICHNRSLAIPREMKSHRKECSIEILPKSGVHRRTELYVKWLESASDLAKAIAQRRKIPDMDKSYHEHGIAILETSIKELGITLNRDQNQAITKALKSSFSLIQGPPGTGKTFTGVALIKLFCSLNTNLQEEQNQSHKFVVFCGPSNKSVDLVTGHLLETFGSSLKILRMYSQALECIEYPIPGKVFSKRRANAEDIPETNLRGVSLHHLIRKPGRACAEKITYFDKKFKNADTIDYKDIREYKMLIGSAIREEIPRYDVILCTTSVATSSRLLSATKKSVFQLLIDEAGMCTEPECLAAIIATHAKQVILIGDHKQLRPVVKCVDAAELGLQKSLFERYAESDKSLLTFMRNQYRMNPSLCQFPSKMFYDNKLITQISLKWQVNKPLRLWRDPRNPCVFCHIEGEEEYSSHPTAEGNEMSRYNMTEVDQVVKVYAHLLKKEGINPDDINIMSQYNAQCTKIRLGLKKQKFSIVNVNTVVASQGGEWDYVIFSLVRSLPEYRIEPKPTRGWCIENLGFITDDHQINVALTRARKGLIIIGNKKLMECEESVFKPLLKEYGRHGCIEDAHNFPPKSIK